MNVFDKMLEGWDEDHWCQFTSGFAIHCLEGRLVDALGMGWRDAMWTKEWRHLGDLVRETTNNPHTSMSQWNDQPERTFADIEAMVRLASVRWDADRVQEAILAEGQPAPF